VGSRPHPQPPGDSRKLLRLLRLRPQFAPVDQPLPLARERKKSND
jgi:hypothetical protein